MNSEKTKNKFKEWLQRYIVAELLGTAIALGFADIAFSHSHSYIIAAGAGFVGEGIGFYGYFITSELLTNRRAYRALPLLKRLSAIIAKSSTNLIIEFAPAEIIDNIFIRPFLMFYMPQHIKPYAFGFIVGKLAADAIFYIFAVVGYEFKKRLQT
jgi:hypothetical protein